MMIVLMIIVGETALSAPTATAQPAPTLPAPDSANKPATDGAPAARGFCPAVLSFFRGVCRIGRFRTVSTVNLLNKNKKSLPGRICVYVCSTQPRALCLYSFKDIN